MTNNLKYKKIISEMSENELKLYKLYSIFEKKFVLKKDFWKNIAFQETVHAKILNKLIDHLDNGLITIIDKYLDQDSVKAFSSYIDDRIENDLNNCDSHLRALEISLLLEKKFLESEMFKMFVIDPKFLKTIFGRLIQETKEHVSLIEDEIESQRSIS